MNFKKGDLVCHNQNNFTRYGVIFEIDSNDLIWCWWRDTIEDALKVTPYKSTNTNKKYVKPVILNWQDIIEVKK